MANRIVIKSNFRKVVGAAHEGLGDAVEKWKDVAEDTAKETLSKKEAQRGYALNTLYDSIQGEKLSDTNARITTDPFYARFFEYGTIYIAPLPFMRPAKRKADKAFVEEAGTSVERAIRRRASV